MKARDTVLALCVELGIQVNLLKSSLTPYQTATYLGVVINSSNFTASPIVKCQVSLRVKVEEFLSYEIQPASMWRSLVGHLSSPTQLIPGGRLRMRSLQLVLRRTWDFKIQNFQIPWTSQVKLDLLWWVEEGNLEKGIFLRSVSPDLAFWSDALDQGWGTFLSSHFASGL